MSKSAISEALERIQLQKCRSSFWEFRKFINPKMKEGWFQEEISNQLERFYFDLRDGKRPKIVIQSPPQHGKSITIVDFIAWASGKNPDMKTIYASYSDRLGVRANLKLQRMYDSSKYKEIFPELSINSKNISTASNQYLRNREIVEYMGREGSFRNTTVRGSVTGETLDLGVIDDPTKGRAEANSEVTRDSTWDWFTDDFFSRFADHAGLLIVLTRWHLDDIVGRLKIKTPDLKIVTFPAIAEKDDLHRKEGEALFPELKPIEFLLERKSVMVNSYWQALYQQNPTTPEGVIINRNWIKTYRTLPLLNEVILSWDMTFKESEKSDFVVGQVWGRRGPEFYLIKEVRARMNFPTTVREFEKMTHEHPMADAKLIEAKANGQATIDTLKEKIAGLIAINPQASKEERTSMAAIYFEAGNVYVPENYDYEEWVSFPHAAHDDRVDAMTQAVNYLAKNVGGDYYGLGVIQR